MEISFSKIGTSLFLIVSGLGLTIFGLVGDQNWWFIMASVFIFLGGIFGAMGGLNMFTKQIRMAIVGVLAVFWVVLAGLDYKSIKDPIDFRDQKRKRYSKVVERLKDIRQAQLGYKSAYNVYASDFETLVNFVKNDSVAVIKAIGFVPDTLTEEQALEMGIISRDTIYEPAMENVYNKAYLTDRGVSVINVDSLSYIPFSGGEMFDIQAGQIERNNLMVQVFEVIAPREKALKGLNKRLTKLEKDLKVGSMTDPTTSGNWGE